MGWCARGRDSDRAFPRLSCRCGCCVSRRRWLMGARCGQRLVQVGLTAAHGCCCRLVLGSHQRKLQSFFWKHVFKSKLHHPRVSDAPRAPPQALRAAVGSAAKGKKRQRELLQPETGGGGRRGSVISFFVLPGLRALALMG